MEDGAGDMGRCIVEGVEAAGAKWRRSGGRGGREEGRDRGDGYQATAGVYPGCSRYT